MHQIQIFNETQTKLSDLNIENLEFEEDEENDEQEDDTSEEENDNIYRLWRQD